MLDVVRAVRNWFARFGLDEPISISIEVGSKEQGHHARHTLHRDTNTLAFDTGLDELLRDSLHGIGFRFWSADDKVVVDQYDIRQIQDLLVQHRHLNGGAGLLLNASHVHALKALGINGPYTEVQRIPRDGWRGA